MDKKTSQDYKIALDFSTSVYKKFKEVIKSIVLFGSVAKEKTTKKSDIDIVIIIDDCTVRWDDELIAWYREELTKILVKNKHKEKLHINTVTLTTFWDEIKAGEPLAINVIRYGQTLIDMGGFFDPLKVLLAKGKIRPTPEAVFTTMERAAKHLGKAKQHLLYAIEGYYWAVVDAAHSALMALKIVPPSPEFINDLLKKTFVDQKRLSKKYLDYYEEIRTTAKKITRGDIKELSPAKIHELQLKAEEFVKILRNLTKSLLKTEKIIKIEEKKV